MKLFAVIKNNIIVEGWFADSYEEAVSDNPDSTIVEVTLENSPWTIGNIYEKE